MVSKLTRDWLRLQSLYVRYSTTEGYNRFWLLGRYARERYNTVTLCCRVIAANNNCISNSNYSSDCSFDSDSKSSISTMPKQKIITAQLIGHNYYPRFRLIPISLLNSSRFAYFGRSKNLSHQIRARTWKNKQPKIKFTIEPIINWINETRAVTKVDQKKKWERES